MESIERARELRDRLNRLLRSRDPVERDALAVEIMTELPPVLRDVRGDAVRDAKADGITAAEFARRRGISKAAVGHILHRAARPADKVAEAADGVEAPGEATGG